MRLRGTNPKEDAMVRRSLPFLATFVALVLLLVAAAPASAYGNVNPFHLRLSRLDPLRCGTPIGIQAQLTDRKGHAVRGVTIHFTIVEGRRGDRLAPANVVTNANGKAVTFVTLVCTNDTHRAQILATGPNGANARITLVLHHPHVRDRHNAAGLLSVTTGSTGTGSGQVATTASHSVVLSPVVATRPSSMALLPVGSALLGVMIMLLAAFRRRLSPRAGRPATA
jgi:hypothetical protein